MSFKSAESLGVEKVDLDEAFARGDVVSNHLAHVPGTVGMLRGAHCEAMPENATFINTGRGPTVNHAEMMEVLRRREDLTAILDVTDPEPLPIPHPLRELPNVRLTSHIAGSIGDEVIRLGRFALDDFERWQNNDPLCYAVTVGMLDTMA
jgi:phosphoglycerate dehydrogenase-like enzyme